MCTNVAFSDGSRRAVASRTVVAPHRASTSPGCSLAVPWATSTGAIRFSTARHQGLRFQRLYTEASTRLNGSENVWNQADANGSKQEPHTIHCKKLCIRQHCGPKQRVEPSGTKWNQTRNQASNATKTMISRTLRVLEPSGTKHGTKRFD